MIGEGTRIVIIIVLCECTSVFKLLDHQYSSCVEQTVHYDGKGVSWSSDHAFHSCNMRWRAQGTDCDGVGCVIRDVVEVEGGSLMVVLCQWGWVYRDCLLNNFRFPLCSMHTSFDILRKPGEAFVSRRCTPNDVSARNDAYASAAQAMPVEARTY